MAVTAVLAACDFGVFRSAFAGVVYSIPTVTDEQVLLDESGRFADEEARVRSSFITGTAGDLNGDGILDGVAVLATNTGGSGTFYTVHAILGDADGGFADVDSVFLGDRIAVPAVAVSGATIEVSILDRAEGRGVRRRTPHPRRGAPRAPGRRALQAARLRRDADGVTAERLPAGVDSGLRRNDDSGVAGMGPGHRSAPGCREDVIGLGGGAWSRARRRTVRGVGGRR